MADQSYSVSELFSVETKYKSDEDSDYTDIDEHFHPEHLWWIYIYI